MTEPSAFMVEWRRTVCEARRFRGGGAVPGNDLFVKRPICLILSSYAAAFADAVNCAAFFLTNSCTLSGP